MKNNNKDKPKDDEYQGKVSLDESDGYSGRVSLDESDGFFGSNNEYRR